MLLKYCKILLIFYFLFSLSLNAHSYSLNDIKRNISLTVKMAKKDFRFIKQQGRIRLNRKKYIEICKDVLNNITYLKNYFFHQGIINNRIFFYMEEIDIKKFKSALLQKRMNKTTFIVRMENFINSLMKIEFKMEYLKKLSHMNNIQVKKNLILKEKVHLKDILSRKEFKTAISIRNPIKNKISYFIHRFLRKYHIKIDEEKFINFVVKMGKFLILFFSILLIFYLLKPYLFLQINKKIADDRLINNRITLNKESLLKNYKKSLKNNDLKNALRYYYLYLIAQLEDMNFLFGEQFLTDREYVELLRKKIHSKALTLFKKIILFYEKKWYGKEQMGQSELVQFTKAANMFLQMVNEKK